MFGLSRISALVEINLNVLAKRLTRFSPLVLPVILCWGLITPGISAKTSSEWGFEDDLQLWMPLNVRAEFPNRVNLMLEIQPRVGENILGPVPEDRNRMLILVLNHGVGYKLNDHFKVWAAGGWQPRFNPQFRNEYRLFQQLDANFHIKRVEIQSRSRIEERFIDNAGGTSLRLRQRIQLSMPIKRGSSWSYVLSDELFWNLNTVERAGREGYDQNRFFVGLNKQISEALEGQAGYLLQTTNARSPQRNAMNHAILVGLTWTVK